MRIKHLHLFILIFFILFTSCCTRPEKADAALKPKLNVSKLRLVKGDEYTIRVYNLSKNKKARFSVVNTKVASIRKVAKNTKKAYIRAVGLGKTVVNVRIKNKRNATIKKFKINITVTPSAISVKLADPPEELKVGDTYKLTTIVKPSISKEVPVFESSDPDVATVNSKGIISCFNEGEVTVVATLLHSGKTATFKLIVRKSETETEK